MANQLLVVVTLLGIRAELVPAGWLVAAWWGGVHDVRCCLEWWCSLLISTTRRECDIMMISSSVPAEHFWSYQPPFVANSWLLKGAGSRAAEQPRPAAPIMRRDDMLLGVACVPTGARMPDEWHSGPPAKKKQKVFFLLVQISLARTVVVDSQPGATVTTSSFPWQERTGP